MKISSVNCYFRHAVTTWVFWRLFKNEKVLVGNIPYFTSYSSMCKLNGRIRNEVDLGVGVPLVCDKKCRTDLVSERKSNGVKNFIKKTTVCFPPIFQKANGMVKETTNTLKKY